MEYVYVNRGGDQEIIADYKKNFEEKSLQELVAKGIISKEGQGKATVYFSL